MKIRMWNKLNHRRYNTKGMKEHCLNCGRPSCAFAGVGNAAGINENNNCWIPQNLKESDAQKIIQEVIERKNSTF